MCFLSRQKAELWLQEAEHALGIECVPPSSTRVGTLAVLGQENLPGRLPLSSYRPVT